MKPTENGGGRTWDVHGCKGLLFSLPRNFRDLKQLVLHLLSQPIHYQRLPEALGVRRFRPFSTGFDDVSLLRFRCALDHGDLVKTTPTESSSSDEFNVHPSSLFGKNAPVFSFRPPSTGWLRFLEPPGLCVFSI